MRNLQLRMKTRLFLWRFAHEMKLVEITWKYRNNVVFVYQKDWSYLDNSFPIVWVFLNLYLYFTRIGIRLISWFVFLNILNLVYNLIRYIHTLIFFFTFSSSVVSSKIINHIYICTSGMLSLRLTDLFQLQVTITEHHFWFKGSRTASPNFRFTSKPNSDFVYLTCFYYWRPKMPRFPRSFPWPSLPQTNTGESRVTETRRFGPYVPLCIDLASRYPQELLCKLMENPKLSTS